MKRAASRITCGWCSRTILPASASQADVLLGLPRRLCLHERCRGRMLAICERADPIDAALGGGHSNRMTKGTVA